RGEERAVIIRSDRVRPLLPRDGGDGRALASERAEGRAPSGEQGVLLGSTRQGEAVAPYPEDAGHRPSSPIPHDSGVGLGLLEELESSQRSRQRTGGVVAKQWRPHPAV